MAQPPLTLLHLTDLHFRGPDKEGHYWNSEATELKVPLDDRRGLLGSLERDLHQQKIRPDLVVVTGDLLDKCAEEGVPLAIAFLAGLCQALGLPHTRVVLVPGNHDVSRDADPASRYASFDAIWAGFYGIDRPAFALGTPPRRRVSRFDFVTDLGVEVVGFNSCVDLVPKANEHGSIGLTQLEHAEALLEATSSRDLFRIAAVHHHLVRPAGVHREDISVMDDAELTLRWLARRHFHLVLHGHQHLDWQDVREIEGWWLSTAAGGSGGVGSYGRSEWMLQLGYQIIAVDAPRATARRIRREYDPAAREWIAAGKGEAVQTLRFGPAPGAAPTPAGLAEPAPDPANAPVDVFVMFAGEDESLAKKLHQHLASLRKGNRIRVHYRDSVDLGGLEQDATAAAVASARIFLVLVSSAFLDSPYFDGPELQRALARVEAGAKARDPLLIPIYLRKCDWQKTELKKYAGLPRDGLPIARRDEDEHFAAIAEALRGVVEKLRRA